MNKKLLLFIISFPFSLICQVDKANEILLDALKTEKIDTTFLPELRIDTNFDYSHSTKVSDENIMLMDGFYFKSNIPYEDTDSLIISYNSRLMKYSDYKPGINYSYSDQKKALKKFNELNRIISEFAIKSWPLNNKRNDEKTEIKYSLARAKEDFFTTVGLYIDKFEAIDGFEFRVTVHFFD